MNADAVHLVITDSTPRLEQLLDFALEDIRFAAASGEELCQGALRKKRLLFAIGVDELGMGAETLALVRCLRRHPDSLKEACAVVLVDGHGELYTKQAAQALVLAANLAGCLFPGKPLVEGTGSLYNQHILAARRGLSPEETYFLRSRELVQRLLDFTPPKSRRPRILMLHASDNHRSNTVAMGNRVLEHLEPYCDEKTMGLQNGSICDCRGCSYKACLHYSQNGTCYYGGPLPTEVFPAILESDAVLLLCPNYNDAPSANIMALINRMTGLLLQQPLYDKYLYSIIVSGYSGGDLVARQVLGALSLNKTMMLPPHFCLFQTANDPGTAMADPDIPLRLEHWSRRILDQLIS